MRADKDISRFKKFSFDIKILAFAILMISLALFISSCAEEKINGLYQGPITNTRAEYTQVKTELNKINESVFDIKNILETDVVIESNVQKILRSIDVFSAKFDSFESTNNNLLAINSSINDISNQIQQYIAIYDQQRRDEQEYSQLLLATKELERNIAEFWMAIGMTSLLAIPQNSSAKTADEQLDMDSMFSFFYRGVMFVLALIAGLIAFIAFSVNVVQRFLQQKIEKMFEEKENKLGGILNEVSEYLEKYTHKYMLLKSSENLINQGTIWYHGYKLEKENIESIVNRKAEGGADADHSLGDSAEADEISPELEIDYYQNVAQLEYAIRLTESALPMLDSINSNSGPLDDNQGVPISIENDLTRAKFKRLVEENKKTVRLMNAHLTCNLAYYYTELFVDDSYRGDKEKCRENAFKNFSQSKVFLDELKSKNYKGWHSLRESQLHTLYFLNIELLKANSDELESFRSDVKEMLAYPPAIADVRWSTDTRKKWNDLINSIIKEPED